jgi:protein TonB
VSRGLGLCIRDRTTAAPSLAAPLAAPDAILPEIPLSSPAASLTDAVGDTLGPAVAGAQGLGDALPLVVVAPQPAPPQQVYRVGGDIRQPRRIAGDAPVYPDLARRARVEGVVILEVLIDEDGRIDRLKVLRSEPLLDAAALDAVRSWRYTPTLLNGVPVPVLGTVSVRFSLQGP